MTIEFSVDELLGAGTTLYDLLDLSAGLPEG
jgi:hypothetical protein